MTLPIHGALLATSLVGLTATGALAQTQGGDVPSVPVSHDDSNKAAATVPPQSIPMPLEREPGDILGASAPSFPRLEQAATDGLNGPTRINDFLSAPLVAFEGSFAIVRGHGYKASASADRFTYSPVVGNRPDASVHLRVRSVRRGQDSLPLAEDAAVHDSGSQIELDRGTMVEAYAYELDSIEQTFRFDELSGSGDLAVTMDLETSLAVSEGPNGLVFSNAAAQVSYSSAFVFDATGVRIPIETTWSPDSITLTVPAGYLAEATLPVTIDPVLSSFVFGGGTADDSRPAAAFDQDLTQYVVVFQDYVSSQDTDLYFFSVGGNGTIDPTSFASLAITGQVSHGRPSIAVNDAANQFLVVSEARPMGNSNRQIDGFLIDEDPASTAGYVPQPAFQINDNVGASDCFNAEVAGNTFSAVNGFSYLVTWTRTWTATDRDVHGRVVATDGSLTTGRINIDNSGADDLQCSVSASLGDSSVQGNYYNVVWVRDTDGDGRGAVWARRIYFNGTFDGPSPSTATQLTSETNCVDPVTTSASIVDLEQTGERYFVVAYPRIFSAGGTSIQSSIYSNVMTFADEVGLSTSITAMEDFLIALDQPECSIASDGRGFMLTYAERSPAGDYDQYMVSGGVQDGPTNTFVTTLSERHQLMANSSEFEFGSRLAGRYDGNVQAGAFSDDAIAVWTLGGNPTTSSIGGARLDLFNNIPSFGDVPIGNQFCTAAQNASGRKGWIRAMAADQSVATEKRLVAIDLTVNAFGYLIVSQTPTFVMNPGGAAGNLCLAGSGRYVNQLANSGTAGAIVTTVDPSSVPQPTGFQSILPGETWYFQLWSRDIAGGMSTSNFTNAVCVTFTP